MPDPAQDLYERVRAGAIEWWPKNQVVSRLLDEAADFIRDSQPAPRLSGPSFEGYPPPVKLPPIEESAYRALHERVGELEDALKAASANGNAAKAELDARLLSIGQALAGLGVDFQRDAGALRG